jgi:steroid delta-isomerase-like uncharacterized protein
MPTEQERNKAIILQMYEEVWNKRNLAFIDEAVSTEFVDNPPKRFFDVPTRGRESLYEAARGFHEGFADFHDEVLNIIAEGDRVVYLGEITGTHTGNLFGVPASGKSVKVYGINYFRMDEGKVVERWGIFDVMVMMQQIGMIPSPGQDGH